MVIGIVMVGYLGMVSSNQRAVVRSETWNATMPVIEAGIEEAMAHLHRNFPTNAESNGWFASGTNYIKWRWMGDGIYLVYIMGTNQPVIESYGYMRLPGNNIYLSRKVRVQTVQTSLVDKVVFAEDGIKLNGNSMRTDSFDSADPLHSTANGRYEPSTAKSGGDIATNSDEQGGFEAGNSQIYGKVSTGPGATVGQSGSGSIGSAAWHQAGNVGTEPGWSSDDCNVPLPPVEMPFNGGAFTPGPGLIGLTLYDYVLGSGNYQLRSFGGKVRVTGNAVLLVTERVQFTGGDQIEIAPGASLRLYVAAADAAIGGNGIINESGLSTGFTYYGLPSNRNLALGGGAEFTGLIYAPNTDVDLKCYIINGAVVCNSAHLNGNTSFHFDEALKNIKYLTRYTIVSWDEI
jgi:hypothetical protein